MPEDENPPLGRTPFGPTVLQTAGRMGELVASFDWAKTPLGPMERWSASLKSIVSVLLHARQPMFLWWGPELIQIYNDAYLPSFGVGKHPTAMGQRGADCWQEIWPIIWPQIDAVMSRGVASWNEDHLVPIFRNQRIEEVYWTYGYSPVFDDDGSIGGTLVVCTETTARVISERRLQTLRALDESAARATDSADVLRRAAEVLGQTPRDVPFALVCELDSEQREAKLVASVGLGLAEAKQVLARRLQGRAAPASLRAAADSGELLVFDDVALPGGPWPEPAREASVVRLPMPRDHETDTFLVLGKSSRLPFDPSYREYGKQLAEHIGISYARTEALQASSAASADREKLLLELSEANRTKDEFLAMLGHELRNPLSPIVTALELLRMRNGGTVGNEERIIERQVSHLVRLVDDLLDVSKITRGTVELRRETVYFDEVVLKAVEIASLLYEQRKHELKVNVPKQLVWHGDPTRIAQVIANLLTNAARYTEPGGHVRLDVTVEGTEIVVRVQDDGIGIAPDMLTKIFEPFVQGARSVDRAEGGLGIGLALAKNLASMHGGEVRGQSEGLGKGSTFTLRLPLPDDVVQVVSKSPSRSPLPSGERSAKRVLIVDDNVDAGELLAHAVRSAGHEVSLAHDGSAALGALVDFAPQVAVLDIGLPVMDGYELASQIRGTPDGGGIFLIALTGYGQSNDRERSKQAGFQRHMVKPVDLDALLTLVAQAP